MFGGINSFTRAVCYLVSWLLISCGNHNSPGRDIPSGEPKTDSEVLNFYNWADNIAPDTISSFEKLTGIKVHVSYFETEEILESRLLTGHSGFDVVVPAAALFLREIRSGAYLPLDKARLPNLVNLDPAFMSRVAINDPGNAYSVPYSWGTFGIGYNKKMVARALPNIPLDSWRLIFDPTYAAKLAPCGILILDAPASVVRLVLEYLGRDPNGPSPKDLADGFLVAADTALSDGDVMYHGQKIEEYISYTSMPRGNESKMRILDPWKQ